jgi:hypothetical protein
MVQGDIGENMRLSKINPILAIALMSVLATSILSTQLSALNSLIHAGHENDDAFDHVALAQSLPLPIDFHYKIKEKVGDAADGNKYVEIDENFIDSENSCEFCTYIKVKPGPTKQTGFVYTNDKGLDLSSAKSVSFFAMGLDGGEKLKFKVAGKTVVDEVKKGPFMPDVNAPGLDLFKGKKFALATEEVTLEKDWVPFSVDLTNVPKEQLTGVTHPFAIEMSNIKGEQEFYIKNIIYRTEEFDLNTLATVADNATLVSNATAVNATTSVSGDNATSLDNVTSTDNSTDATDNATQDVPNNLTDVQAPEESDEIPVNDTDIEANDTAITDSESAEENATLSTAVEENTPPIAQANDDILAYPGDTVILDGLASFDEDGNELAYQWTQSDGPDVEIAGEDTATPTVTIPSDIDEDGEVVIDLVVTDGEAESERYSLTIFIDYVEPPSDSDVQVETQELAPDFVQDSEWDTECSDLVECLSDDDEDTFASASGSEEEDELADLLSFQDLDLEENSDVEIKQVIIQADAAKSGDTGYIRFIVDDSESFESGLVSITSNEMVQYRLVLDEDPVTGDAWTVDSLNSVIAGYAHGGGEVKVTALKAIVLYSIMPSEVVLEEEEEDQNLPEEASEPEEEGDSNSAIESNEEEETPEGSEVIDEEFESSAATVEGNATGGDDEEQVDNEEEEAE